MQLKFWKSHEKHEGNFKEDLTKSPHQVWGFECLAVLLLGGRAAGEAEV